jgi:hypothetical protein
MSRPMSVVGLGCVKSPRPLGDAEPFPIILCRQSQNVLLMPFKDAFENYIFSRIFICMSFHTAKARLKLRHCTMLTSSLLILNIANIC